MCVSASDVVVDDSFHEIINADCERLQFGIDNINEKLTKTEFGTLKNGKVQIQFNLECSDNSEETNSFFNTQKSVSYAKLTTNIIPLCMTNSIYNQKVYFNHGADLGNFSESFYHRYGYYHPTTELLKKSGIRLSNPTGEFNEIGKEIYEFAHDVEHSGFSGVVRHSIDWMMFPACE